MEVFRRDVPQQEAHELFFFALRLTARVKAASPLVIVYSRVIFIGYFSFLYFSHFSDFASFTFNSISIISISHFIFF